MSPATSGPQRPDRRIGPHQLAPLLPDWRTPGSKVPGYRALADRLRLLVLDGRLPVGTVLPSERALAEALGASRTTTTAAYRLLREEGFAHGSHGAGTWTALPASDDAGAVPAPFPTSMDGLPWTPDGRGDFASAAAAAPPEVHGAYAAALAELPRYLPGHGYVNAGLPVLRSRIAALYTARGLPTAADEVLVTAGALHGLHLVVSQVVQPGDRVLVEHPTYPLFFDAIRRAGGRPVPVPIEDGWDPELLRTVLRQTGARLAILIPDFHNPTGRLMDGPTREAVARALAEAGCVTVVDESTQSLDLRAALGRAAPAVPPFAAVAGHGVVVTIGSASKMVWGGLRIGWVRADRTMIRGTTVARAGDDGGGPLLEQLACANLLEDVGPMLARRRLELAEGYRTLRAALAVALPDWEVPEPEGGMVAWCRLPQPRSSELVSAARTRGLNVTAGPRFGVDGAFESRLRLPYSRPPDYLHAAVRSLAEAWRSPGMPSFVAPPAYGSDYASEPLAADVV